MTGCKGGGEACRELYDLPSERIAQCIPVILGPNTRHVSASIFKVSLAVVSEVSRLFDQLGTRHHVSLSIYRCTRSAAIHRVRPNTRLQYATPSSQLEPRLTTHPRSRHPLPLLQQHLHGANLRPGADQLLLQLHLHDSHHRVGGPDVRDPAPAAALHGRRVSDVRRRGVQRCRGRDVRDYLQYTVRRDRDCG